jgi:hypothetical protein
MSPKKSYRSAVPSFACRGGKPTTSGDGGAGLRLQELDDGTMFVVDKMGKDGSFRSLRERRPNRICHCSRIRADLWLVAVHPSDDAAGGRFRQIDPSRPRHEADPPNRGHIFSLSRAGMRCRKGGRAEHVAPLFICCCS